MTRKSQDDRPILPPGKLTAVTVRNLTKAGLYADGLGLYLQISKWGTKSWIYRYMVKGRAHKLGLGPIYTVSLSEAREAALDARSGLRRGVDPIVARKAALGLLRLEAAKEMTFRQCAEAFIDANRAGWRSAKHASQWPATLQAYAYPAFGHLPVAAIDTALVTRALEPIWVSKTETASRLRGRIESILDWARVRGYRTGDNPARWRGHLEQILPRPSKVARIEHHKALPYADLPTFMSELRAKQGAAARALEFAILTAGRLGEVAGSTWDEIDIANGVWAIPAERMKAHKEHRVPLSDRALAILTALPCDGVNVFAANAHSIRKVLRDARAGVTIHGFRSSFRDWAGDATTFPREIAEAALAHSLGDETERAYRRGDAMAKRRELMSAWANYCERPPAKGDNVVSLREIA